MATVISPRNSKRARRIAVVGGGLAGISAALAAVQAQPEGSLPVLLLEKEETLGGQRAPSRRSIDSRRSLDMRPNLPTSMDDCGEDPLEGMKNTDEALSWLMSQGLKLDTERDGSNEAEADAFLKELISKVRASEGVYVVTGCTVQKLLTANGEIKGLQYSVKTGKPQEVEVGAVVITVGNVSTTPEAVQKLCPGIAQFASTNQIGSQASQLHPTGLVDPKCPKHSTRMLAPESLRKCGAILLNLDGRRFVNELASPGEVAKAISEQKGGWAYLVLGEAGSHEFGHKGLGYYCSRDLMDPVEGIMGLATDMGLSMRNLQAELEAYNKAAGGGKPDPFGKTTFPGPIDLDGPLYVMRVAPVQHYTLGGLAVNDQGEVVDEQGSAIPGLYAAGGVAGNTRATHPNSMLQSVAFGRLAGAEAIEYVQSL